MKDVFISYSRRDMVFAGRLVESLQREDLESWIDWKGIPYSAEWWLEICKGIDEAKNFVFIISPNSLASRVCNLEVQYARENNKRIIPVVRQEVDVKMLAGEWFGKDWESIARKNYEELAKLNYIFLRKKKGYDCNFDPEKRVVTNPECD